MEDSVTPDKLDTALALMVSQFENAEETTRSAREKSEKCRDYFDDKQLTSAEENELRSRGQPPVVFNEIKPKVKTLLGLEKQTRKDPKAFPRNPSDEDAAAAATDAIRFVCDASRWDDVRSKAAKNLGIEGTAAIMIGVKQTKDGIDPEVRRIAWDRHYADPHSSEDDFTDAAFQGNVVWMDLDDALVKYPDATAALNSTWAASRDTDTYDDKPKHNLWADYKRRRVRLCEHYYTEGGVWKFCIFTKSGFVVEPQDSPYLDDQGRPECPIKAISLYVDRENNRYGEVQAMLSPQDEINKRRSKSLHLINTRQIRVSPNVATDPNEVRKELTRPDGVFIGDQGDVDIFQTNDMATGNLNLMQDAREHIHRTGANSAMAGKDTGGQSGKAIALQQMGGMTESADFLDCIRRLSLSVYSAVWSRIRQYWTEERWIRVTDNEKNVRFVGLNRPVTFIQAAAEQMGITKANMQEAPPEALQQLEMLARDPRAGQVVKIENNVSELDVDILVDEGVDTPTIAAEQFDTLAKIMPGIINLPPPMMKMLIQASSLRDKAEMLKQLEEMGQGPQIPPEVQQQMEEVVNRLKEVEAENVQLKADTRVKEAEVQIKGAELGIKGSELELRSKEVEIMGFEAETARIVALKPEQQAA